jgi:biotin carboxyl carrier protein
MKMEIPVAAQRTGKLAHFPIEECKAVSEGQPSAEIDWDSSKKPLVR